MAEVLDVQRDDPGLVVLGEGGDQLGCFDVGLVSERGEAGEAEAVVGCDQRELESEVAALGDEPDLTGRKLAPADVERGRRVVDAEAVRAEQDRTGGPDAIDDRLLAGAALRRPSRRARR